MVSHRRRTPGHGRRTFWRHLRRVLPHDEQPGEAEGDGAGRDWGDDGGECLGEAGKRQCRGPVRRVSRAKPRAGRTDADAVSMGEPTSGQRGWATHVEYDQGDEKECPLVRFEFLFRTEGGLVSSSPWSRWKRECRLTPLILEALKQLRIIPRTPSPTPLEDMDFEGLTQSQRMVLAVRLLAKHEVRFFHSFSPHCSSFTLGKAAHSSCTDDISTT